MIQIWELAEKTFEITIINMLKKIKEKMDKINFKMKNSNREVYRESNPQFGTEKVQFIKLRTQ